MAEDTTINEALVNEFMAPVLAGQLTESQIRVVLAKLTRLLASNERPMHNGQKVNLATCDAVVQRMRELL